MKYVNVDDMGKARENRKMTQDKLLLKSHMTLVSFTLNIPGPVKDEPLYKTIHNQGIIEIEKIICDHIYDKLVNLYYTGPEAFWTVDLDPVYTKRQMIILENDFYLGRIFDIDVLKPDGKVLSRTDLNIIPRKCLICDEFAAICSRSRKHTINDLIYEIERISACLKGI